LQVIGKMLELYGCYDKCAGSQWYGVLLFILALIPCHPERTCSGYRVEFTDAWPEASNPLRCDVVSFTYVSTLSILPLGYERRLR
jgi:hypothetical protein